MLDAKTRRWGAAGIAQYDVDIGDIDVGQWDGQDISVVHGPNAIPSSDVDLIVEACAKGVCRPTISVYLEGDSVLGPTEMLIKDLASHQMCGPSLQHSGPEQKQKPCRSEKMSYVG